MKKSLLFLIALIFLLGAGNLLAQDGDCDPPVIVCPDFPFELTMCGPGTVCVDMPVESPTPVTIEAGEAYMSADKGAGQLCWNVDTSGAYTFTVYAYNDCGADTCVVTAIVTINEKPVIDCPQEDFSMEICEPQEICLDLPILDAENVYVNGATWENGELCFFADEAGIYNFDVIAENGCGTDTCQIIYEVIFLAPPTIVCPEEAVEAAICPGDEVCVDIPILGADEISTTLGTYENGQLCFTPANDGPQSITITASNMCDTNTCIVDFDIIFIPPPMIHCDQEVYMDTLCEADQVCIDLLIENYDGVDVTNNGIWADGQLCFQADTAGEYTFTVTAENECGTDECMLAVFVTFVPDPVITCPEEPLEITVCEGDLGEVIVPITGASLVVASYGEWDDGRLYFLADTSGVYMIELIAYNACEVADTCNLEINVTTDTPPVITCPEEDLNFEICETGQFCFDLPVENADDVILDGVGTYDPANQQVCVDIPDSEGGQNLQFDFLMIASNQCGADTCDFTAFVHYSPPPEIFCPSDTAITICLASYVRIPVPVAYYTDIQITGADYVNGQVEFVATESEMREITIIATGQCGVDTCQFTIDLTVIEHPNPEFSIDSAVQGQSSVIVYFSNDTEFSGDMSFEWDFGDGATSTEFEPSHAYDSNGCYDVSLYAENECGTATHTIFDFVCITDLQIVIPTTEWISIYCEFPMLDGEPLIPGDIISAYDPDGVLCGMGEVGDDGSYGFMPIYRDDPTTEEEDEGAEPGDIISMQINFNQVFPIPSLIWTENGDRIEVCNFSTENCVTLDLESGWNLKSWNVAYSEGVESFISGWEECVGVILGFEEGALTYNPDLPEFSTLHTLDYFHGYWFRMDCPYQKQLCAGEIPTNSYIDLEMGWNLAAYWPQTVYDIDEALASIMNILLVALGFDNGGLSWEPGMGGLNTLTELTPGLGYWYKVSEDGMLFYPGFGVIEMMPSGNGSSYAAEIQPSRTWINIYGRDIRLDDVALEPNTSIEVYSSSGALCGKAVYNGSLLKFTPVYGFDRQTPVSKVYAHEGESLSIFVNGTRVYPEITWNIIGDCVDISTLYTKGGGSSPVVPDRYSLAQNYPNPFNPSTVIKFNLPQPGNAEVAVYNTLGQKVATLVNGYFDAGEYETTWNGLDDNGQKVSSGVYLYRLQTDNYEETQKMILAK